MRVSFLTLPVLVITAAAVSTAEPSGGTAPAPAAKSAGASAAAGHPHGRPEFMSQPLLRYDLAGDSVAVPMNLADGRIIFDVRVNGKGPFAFIFDTGAQGSVMDLSLAKELGLSLGQEVMVGSPNGGGVPGHLVTLETVAVAGLTLHDLPSIAFDHMPTHKSQVPARGVLGPYSLAGLLVELDYPGNRVVFRRGALPEPDGREVFGWDRHTGLPEIPAAVAGQPLMVHLDSGSSGGVSLPTGLASKLPLDGPLQEAGFAKAVDHTRTVQSAALKGAFTIGRYTWDHPTLHFFDIEKGTGNVGAAVLSQFVLTIDPQNARLRLAGPADGRLQVTQVSKPRYGIKLEKLDASRVTVRDVDAGSPAEKAGLRAGDQIVQMNGRPVESLSMDDRVKALTSSPLRVKVKRGGTSTDLTLELPAE